ncbi:uncharacterized protein LOC124165029 [Ischnura elegans]|uniref:uncharacterized protein LOC124165029 n=1 Tax=Ischnura elegans TaxID=197161 RepID=UPI001ED8BB47|nr:uncharacterized protein LOC124165029 [Ischnura elegans]
MSHEGEIPATPLSDRECLLVQFVHERKKPVQVAFQAWVKDRSLDLKKAVESEIVIRWPCEVDVVCAKLMERKLRNCVNWQDLVVKVRAVGEWTDMCRQASSIKKFGVPNPTKKERRQLCAKMISSSEGEMSTTEEENNDTIDGGGKQKKRQCSSNPKSRKAMNVVVKTTNNEVANRIRDLPLDHLLRSDVISDDDDDDDSSDFENSSKSRLLQKISILQEENKKLRQDNARLRALRCVSEDLEKVLENSTAVREMMLKLKGDMVSLTNAASTSRKANRTGNSSSCSSSGSLINNQCTTTNAPASVSQSSVSGDPQHDIGDEEV